jgi:hypothetical protein
LHTSSAETGDGPLAATLTPAWAALAATATFN